LPPRGSSSSYRLALKQNGLPPQEILDHRYLKVLAWSRDSTCILVGLKGHGGTREQAVTIQNWIGVYDLAKGEIDLGKMNRGALKEEARVN
jgi:hypothetical protein